MSFLSHLSWKKALTSIYYMYVVGMDVLTAVPPKKTTQTTNDYKVFLINHMVQALDGLLQRKSLRFAVQWH